MDRQEKRAIRWEIISILEKRCKGCTKAERAISGGSSYCHSSCKFGIRLLELSGKLEKKKILKVTDENYVKRGRWTKEEIDFLLNNQGLSPVEISAKINRSRKSVYAKRRWLKQRSVVNA